MKKCYETFREICRSRLRDERVKQSTHQELIESGFPTTFIEEFTGIRENGLNKIACSCNAELRINNRRSLIYEAYRNLFGNKTGLVGLEDYVQTYDIRGVLSKFAILLDNLDELAEAGYAFDFTPSGKDAYLMGANLGGGSLAEDFKFHFTGNNEHLKRIKDLANIRLMNGSHHGIVLPNSLGRLFYLLGLPKGDRMKADLQIPEWIKQSRELKRNFLAGILDTATSYGYSHFNLSTFISTSHRIPFFKYWNALADMIEEFGVNLTERRLSFNYEGDNLIGNIYISRRVENIRKIKRQFPIKKSLSNHPITKFEQRVYDFVFTIPRGETRNYADIARSVGGSPKAVGQALRKDKDSGCPSHRVIYSDGKLGGYTQGTLLKRQKLEEEGVILR